ncbi:MAG TPA: heme exporter protein CcmB [Candidatus Thermoplasmatota archaeon]|nr:heme exporter protein CcmB [Candidatus Thermoplasmatota archaeon]
MSFAALLWKDLRREARGKEALQSGLVLLGLFLVLDLFAFPTLQGSPRAAAAALWTPLLYGGAALTGRGFAAEADRGTLDLLRSAPVPLLWHGLSRAAVHTLLTAGLALLGLGGIWLLFGVAAPLPLAAALLLGAVGVAVAGTATSALAAQARSRDVLLPILLVPVLAPLLQAGLRATIAGLDGASLADLRLPLLLMAGYDLVALGAALLVVPIALEGD